MNPTAEPDGSVSTLDGEGRADRLASEAAGAARIRALMTDPDVIALRVERVRSQVDALLWAGIVLGLAFTMVNVQTFAAAGAAMWSPAWLVAWLLDPMVSVVLLAVLRAEQVTARYQVALPVWARRTKWLTFAATYVMNTWTSWGLAGGTLSWAGVVLHSVPPLVVFAAAETGPGLRDRLTEAVHRAATERGAAHQAPAEPSTLEPPAVEPAAVEPAAAEPVAVEHPAAPVVVGEGSPIAVHEPVNTSAASGVHETADERVHEPEPTPVPTRRATPRRVPSGRGTAGRGRPVPRRLLPEFIATARAGLESAHANGVLVEPTPAWVARVTGCSAGTSVKVAAVLRATSNPTKTQAKTPTEAPIADRAAVAA